MIDTSRVDDMAYARKLDREDRLRGYRERFFLPTDVVYFDGNSLGPPSRLSSDRLMGYVKGRWAGKGVELWDEDIGYARRVGDKIAPLIGAEEGEVIVTDSTTVNLFKLAGAAVLNGRTVLVTNKGNFPTDRYVLQQLERLRPRDVQVHMFDSDYVYGPSVEDIETVLGQFDPKKVFIALSHTDYGSGALAPMKEINTVAREAGAEVSWDLCHTTGAVDPELVVSGAGTATGCTYKYMNGGPGAPAFIRIPLDRQEMLENPIGGWFGQEDQFGMGDPYTPVATIERWQTGTPSIPALVLIQAGVDVLAEAGMDEIREKNIDLTEYAIALHDEWLTQHGFTLATPREAERRGSHVSFQHDEAMRISKALRARNVVPDFRRNPSRLRLGFSSLYTRFEDVYTGMGILKDVMEQEEYETFSSEPDRVT